MSNDKLPLSFSRETLEEVKSLLRGADPGAPLVDRLRNPRTPYSPALLREEAADRIEELEAKLAKAVEALELTRRADDLREAYHILPNDKNRIGDKKSKKSRARDAWLRAFRKAAKEARAALAEINGGGDE